MLTSRIFAIECTVLDSPLTFAASWRDDSRVSRFPGGLAQLGERMAGSHEVIGSNPLSSTQFVLPRVPSGHFGGLAQLGERMAGSHEVIGSNPLSST